jgi:hypothetical protein
VSEPPAATDANDGDLDFDDRAPTPFPAMAIIPG